MSIRQAIDNDGFPGRGFSFLARRQEWHFAGGYRIVRCRKPGGHSPRVAVAPVANMAGDQVLIDLARSVLRPTAFPFPAAWFDKSATTNWLVLRHRDTALPWCHRIECPGWGPWSVRAGIAYGHAPAGGLSQVLALRIHLDDSTSGNGPARVLPGTHTVARLSHGAIEDLTNEISPVDGVCPKSGVVAMKPLPLHASSKSQGDAARRLLHIEYAASESIATPLPLATP